MKTETPQPRPSAAYLYINRPECKGAKAFIDFVVKAEADAFADMSDYFTKRDRFSRYMENELGGRTTDPETDTTNIFNRSNHTLGAVRSQILFKVASSRDALLGSTPWFAVLPEGTEDTELAEQIYRHFKWKLDAADTTTTVEESIERCYNMGESVVRLVWDRRVDRFERIADVLVDSDGNPVLTKGGDYIESDAATTMVAMDGSALPDPIDGEPAPEGKLVFADAPEIESPTVENGMRWEPLAIDEEAVLFNGIRYIHVDYTAFRCQMGYSNVAESPFRGHVYEIHRSELRERLLVLYGEQDQWPDHINHIWQVTRTATSEHKTQEKISRSGSTGDMDNPILKMLDVECQWVANPDTGEARWYFATVLLDHQDCEPVFIDYLANVVPTEQNMYRSLYNSIAIDPLPCSWAGRGEWEKYEEFNTLVDQLWNNMLVRDGWSANPITVFNPDVIKEHKDTIRFEPGAKFTLQQDANPADFMHFFSMPDTNFRTNEQLQFVINTNMLETGVTSAAKGGVGDLPATNTATGIQSVLASGSTLSHKPQSDIQRGWERSLKVGAAMQYSKQDKNETFRYSESGSTQLVTLTAASVRNLSMDVTLLMTRAHNVQALEKNREAKDTLSWYLNFPESEKAGARILGIAALKAMEIPNANDILRLPMEPDPEAQSSALFDKMKVDLDKAPAVIQAQFWKKQGFEVTPEQILAEKVTKEHGDKQATEPAKTQP